MSDTGSDGGAEARSQKESGASEASAKEDRVTVLEPGMWRALSQARGLDATAAAWSPLMYAMLDEALVCAVFLKDSSGGPMRVLSVWPKNRIPNGSLLTASENAMREGRGVVRGAMPGEKTEESGLVAVAVPIIIDEQAYGAVGFEAKGISREYLQDGMRKLQWGAAWIRDAMRGLEAEQKDRRYAHAVSALHALTTVAEQDGFVNAARSAATDLATRFECDRVSIGFRRLGRSRVRAISHSAEFGKQMNLVRLLAAAMDEAVDQRGVVIYPASASSDLMATHRHEKLAHAYSIANILTCPLYSVDRFVGAIIFERPADRPFTQDDADILEAVSTVIAPVLDEVRRNDRFLITIAVESLGRQFARLAGPGRLIRKAIVLVFLAAIAFFWFVTAADRISADARVEGTIQRAITAPFDGFIASSGVRAGDRVEEGDVLVRMDDRELTLERLRLLSELQLQQIEYDRALAELNRTESSIRRNQMYQAQLQISLIDKQLERTKLVAPFAGIIVSGDLSQSIGASIVRGETLMTIVPPNDFRIVLQVEERRIADVTVGQLGSLLVTALPEQTFPFEITKITPVATYGDGRTTFRVDAALTANAEGLQPGMEGVAKVQAGERRLIAVWADPMVDWFRISIWSWFGLRVE